MLRDDGVVRGGGGRRRGSLGVVVVGVRRSRRFFFGGGARTRHDDDGDDARERARGWRSRRGGRDAARRSAGGALSSRGRPTPRAEARSAVMDERGRRRCVQPNLFSEVGRGRAVAVPSRKRDLDRVASLIRARAARPHDTRVFTALIPRPRLSEHGANAQARVLRRHGPRCVAATARPRRRVAFELHLFFPNFFHEKTVSRVRKPSIIDRSTDSCGSTPSRAVGRDPTPRRPDLRATNDATPQASLS